MSYYYTLTIGSETFRSSTVFDEEDQAASSRAEVAAVLGDGSNVAVSEILFEQDVWSDSTHLGTTGL
jgi:hypothetical protein